MAPPVRLTAQAQAEFDEAVDWMDARRPGSGGRFAGAVHRVLAVIAAQPHLYAEVYNDVREALVPRYRYAVYDRAEPRRVRVIAVYHTSRDPAGWQGRA